MSDRTDGERSRVVVFATVPLWPVQQGVLLEVAIRHVRLGDEVAFAQCRGVLATCPPNPHHRRVLCALCRRTCDHGLAVAGLDHCRVVTMEPGDLPPAGAVEAVLDREAPVTVHDLAEMSVGGYGLGEFVASTLISRHREPAPSVGDHWVEIAHLFRAAWSLANFTARVLDSVEPESVYLFNGRLITGAPVAAACQARRVRHVTLEVDAAQRGYFEFEGNSLWDLEALKSDLRAVASRLDVEERDRRASAFFARRRSGSKMRRIDFTAGQSPGALPDDLDPSARNVAVFLSSEDEFAAVRGWRNPFYENQARALEAISSDARVVRSGLVLWVRVHPNLREVRNSQTRWLAGFRAANVRVIGAHEECDSYALAEVCEKTLTFGSTMGIEAAWLSKPSVLAGHALYEGLGSVYEPDSHDDLIGLLCRPLSTLPAEGAADFAAYVSRPPTPFAALRCTDDDALLNGQSLLAPNEVIRNGRLLYLWAKRRLGRMR